MAKLHLRTELKGGRDGEKRLSWLRQLVGIITITVPFQLVENNYSSLTSMTSSLFLPRIREAAKTHKLVEQELAHSVNATALVLTEAKLSSPEVGHQGGGKGDRWMDLWLI